MFLLSWGPKNRGLIQDYKDQQQFKENIYLLMSTGSTAFYIPQYVAVKNRTDLFSGYSIKVMGIMFALQ